MRRCEVEEIKLRPHHLLCIQKFKGMGYDGVFTNHLAETVRFLTANPQTEITLFKGCDEVCKSCPNNSEGACTDGEKVSALDDGVLDTCKLKYGEKGTWQSLSRTARERVFESEDFERICSSCQWYYLCKDKAD